MTAFYVYSVALICQQMYICGVGCLLVQQMWIYMVYVHSLLDQTEHILLLMQMGMYFSVCRHQLLCVSAQN